MKLKPVPKLILILAVVGGVGFGVNSFLESRAKNAPAVEAVATPAPFVQPTASTVNAVQASAPAQAAPTYQATPQPAAPVDDGQPNAGLSKLLQSKK